MKGSGTSGIIDKVINGGDGRLLQYPFFYAVGRKAVRCGLIKFPYKATTMLAEYGLGQMKEVYGQKKALAWSTAFFPTELFFAMGIVHFSPEVAAAMAASFDLQSNLLNEAEKRGWGRDSCSFHRCALGGSLLDFFPRPKVFCAATHLCDGAVSLFNNLSSRYALPLLLLDTPVKKDRAALQYVVRQLESIITSLQELSGEKMQHLKLQKAVLYADQARQQLANVNRWRAHPLSAFGARDALAYLYLYFSGIGGKRTPEIYKTLAHELKQNLEKAATAGATPPRYRLLWLHLPPLHRNNVLAYLEQKGARVVFEEFSHAYWEPMDPEKPLESIARRMLDHFGHGCIGQRLQAVKTMVEQFDVDGVIHFSHWGCRQNCGSVNIIRDFLRREGIPLLLLDGDCIDNRNYSPGQVHTRIDSFLEMLS